MRLTQRYERNPKYLEQLRRIAQNEPTVKLEAREPTHHWVRRIETDGFDPVEMPKHTKVFVPAVQFRPQIDPAGYWVDAFTP